MYMKMHGFQYFMHYKTHNYVHAISFTTKPNWYCMLAICLVSFETIIIINLYFICLPACHRPGCTMAMALLFSTTQIILVPLSIFCTKNDQSTVPWCLFCPPCFYFLLQWHKRCSLANCSNFGMNT